MLSKLAPKRLYQIVLLLVVLLFVLVNLCAGLLQQKFNITLDLTEEKLYAFSQSTFEVLDYLQEPTTLYVLSREEDYPSMLREVLSRYSKLSSNITVTYIDPYQNPVFLDHYRQLGHSFNETDILVQGSRRAQVIAYKDILVYSGERVTGINMEQQITGALLYVNSTETPVVAFTTGHNERTTNALQRLFTGNFFEVRTLSLATQGLDGVDIAVIASPAKDFEPSELAQLTAHLERGGSLMVFIEPGVNTFPNLSAFLEDWNIAFENNLVFEEKAYVSDNPINIIPMYADHAINQYFVQNPYYVVMPSARGIKLLSGGKSGAEVSRVLISTPGSYAKTSLQYDSPQKQEGDLSGPFVLAAVAQRQLQEGQAKIFAAGSRYLYADDVMGVESYANSTFLSQTVNYLWQGHATVSIPPKTIQTPPINISLSRSIVWGVLLAIIIPLGVAAVGIWVYVKRKNL